MGTGNMYECRSLAKASFSPFSVPFSSPVHSLYLQPRERESREELYVSLYIYNLLLKHQTLINLGSQQHPYDMTSETHHDSPIHPLSSLSHRLHKGRVILLQNFPRLSLSFSLFLKMCNKKISNYINRHCTEL